MRYFLVYAHPEPTSLNAHLKNRAVEGLLDAGHDVRVSDLYAMRWKAVADADDFPARDRAQPLNYARASGEAFASGTQLPEIALEQDNLVWADTVILQFPIWWYGMPAILKGWVDRVLALGFGYGLGPHEDSKWGRRFGEGTLEGRRAMVGMTVGGRAAHYGPRGVNGSIDDLLWPIHHGVLFYPGMQVVPPAIFYEVMQPSASAVEQMAQHYLDRLLTIPSTELIPFRTQNGGDYDDQQVLHRGIEGGATGLSMHQRAPAYVANLATGRSGDYAPRHFAPSSRDADADRGDSVAMTSSSDVFELAGAEAV